MNTISASFQNSLAINFEKAFAGAALQLAAGIMGKFMNPLGAGPNAFAKLPEMFKISCGFLNQGGQGIWAGPDGKGCYRPDAGGSRPGRACIPEPEAQWTTKMTGRNTADIDLGDGYTLKIDERSSEMYINNAETGEKTRIWGDPHVVVDGKHAFDFWGTTTFTLENGTKITVNTEQWKGNPNAYVASQIVITKGSNAIVVDGISQNQLGDLSVTMSQNGYAVDAQHRDGFVLQENDSGSGWIAETTGDIATQTDLNATRPGEAYGPGSDMPSLGEMSGALSLFLFAGQLGALMNFAFTGETGSRNENAADRNPVRTLLNPNTQTA